MKNPSRPRVLAALVMLGIMIGACSERPTEPFLPDVAQSTLVDPTNPLVMNANGAWHFLPQPPAGWQDLIVYAHGYRSPYEPPWTPDQDEIDGLPIAAIVHGLGFAYASTSYPGAGLVVPAAVDDMVSLVEDFRNAYGTPRFVFIVGPSEGGLITTLAVEKRPDVFSGGLALCGPYGDFRRQINYFGDFHVLFNYFFPTLKAGSPAGVPPGFISGWNMYEQHVRDAVAAQSGKAQQLIRTSKAAVDAADPTTVPETIVDVLWYNVWATNDALARLGGQPFDNASPVRWYRGSNNDWRLNWRVQRFHANSNAAATIDAGFQTSGRLARPLVMLHTTGDPIVPYWHQTLYRLKVLFGGSSLLYTGIPVNRYGHCEFEMAEVLTGLSVLILKATLQDLLVSETLLPDAGARARLEALASEYGARPVVVSPSHIIR